MSPLMAMEVALVNNPSVDSSHIVFGGVNDVCVGCRGSSASTTTKQNR